MVDGFINFNLNEKTPTIIKVIGVGGGGGNAVEYMYEKGICDVDFVICNTDYQALRNSPIPCKIQLGKELTAGHGAGNNPAMGEKSAQESLADIEAILKKVKLKRSQINSSFFRLKAPQFPDSYPPL